MQEFLSLSDVPEANRDAAFNEALKFSYARREESAFDCSPKVEAKRREFIAGSIFAKYLDELIEMQEEDCDDANREELSIYLCAAIFDGQSNVDIEDESTFLKDIGFAKISVADTAQAYLDSDFANCAYNEYGDFCEIFAKHGATRSE
jgi:hypothetical protein